jgi:membrane-bound serine protease (ClpP class)
MKLFFSITISLLSINIWAQSKVFVLKIRAEIDPRMSRYVDLALEKAEKSNSDYIIVDMDTYGGAVNDADHIRTQFLNSKKPIWVFINKNAASAGALISIACDSIYMQQGSSIGAATVVNGNDGMAAPDKYQSYMRSMMRATAEANNRNPSIAEAMVDPDVTLDSSIKKTGKVLTFTTSEAIKNKFCEAEINSIDDILKRNQIQNYQIETFELSNAEKIIAFFLNPAISGILILIIIGGIYFELQTPGVGFPLIAACVAAILYFTPYYMNGLAQNWEILLFLAGVALLAVEIFAIPGFGVVGISGIICIFASLLLSMLNNDFLNFDFVKTDDLYYAMLSILVSFLVSIGLIIYGSKQLINSPYFKKVSLNNHKIESLQDNFGSEGSFMGVKGQAVTPLRPSGKIKINNQIEEATTNGEFIDQGSEIEIIGSKYNTLVVKQTNA